MLKSEVDRPSIFQSSRLVMMSYEQGGKTHVLRIPVASDLRLYAVIVAVSLGSQVCRG